MSVPTQIPLFPVVTLESLLDGASSLSITPPVWPLAVFCAWTLQVPELSEAPMRQVLCKREGVHECILLSCDVHTTTEAVRLWLRIERLPGRRGIGVLFNKPTPAMDIVQASTNLQALGGPCEPCDSFVYNSNDPPREVLRLKHVAEMCKYFMGHRIEYSLLGANCRWLCCALLECLRACQPCYGGTWFSSQADRPTAEVRAAQLAKCHYLQDKHPTCCGSQYLSHPAFGAGLNRASGAGNQGAIYHTPRSLSGSVLLGRESSTLPTNAGGNLDVTIGPQLFANNGRPSDSIRESTLLTVQVPNLVDTRYQPVSGLPEILPPGSTLTKSKSQSWPPQEPALNIIEDNEIIPKEGINPVDLLHSSLMTPSDMLQCLVKHGCNDLTSLIDPEKYSGCRVAVGGFGDIWEGELRGGTNVAVKTLRFALLVEGETKGLKIMLREIYNWSKLDHENVHKLLGVTLFQGQLAMVSKWMANGNLRDHLGRNKGLDRHELCTKIARGVEYIHTRAMIHGDLKAVRKLNKLIEPDGAIKLTDFDYSIISDCSLLFTETTRVGGGTLRWMAPELVVETTHPRSKQSDIYALGMTFLEVITGAPPYYPLCRNDAQVMFKVAQKIVPERCPEYFANDHKGNAMWELLTQCWNYDPALRPAAREVLGSLSNISYIQKQDEVICEV